MNLSKITNPVIISASPDFNMLGLRKSQASLYKLLERCAKDGTNIQLKRVCEIYFNEVKNPNGLWVKDKAYYYSRHAKPGSPILTLKNKDAFKFFTTDKQYSSYFSSWYANPVRGWMKGVIGSLVMRGMLHVIPKIDTDLLEK